MRRSQPDTSASLRAMARATTLGGRRRDAGWMAQGPHDPLLWVWTLDQVARLCGGRRSDVLDACEILSVNPRRIDADRPGLWLVSAWDASRVRALLAERRGRRRIRRRNVVSALSTAVADLQLLALTDLLDGLYSGPPHLVDGIVDKLESRTCIHQDRW